MRAFTDSRIGDPSWKGSGRMLVLSSMSISAKGGYKRDALPWSFAFVQNGTSPRGAREASKKGERERREKLTSCRGNRFSSLGWHYSSEFVTQCYSTSPFVGDCYLTTKIPKESRSRNSKREIKHRVVNRTRRQPRTEMLF